jgi:sigma-B regulation protein RsbU (phosphoserine phosphatase)
VTRPAEEVGGDVYDVQDVEAGVLGLMLADASGHGLPAALQARDAVTGLRMGQSGHLKVTSLIERLNLVVHQSGLSSRFISLFYGELEVTGNLIYVNCGHCPPLLFRADGGVFELPTTGPVLGPLPGARYQRSFAALRPGDVLVAYTDGVTERHPPGEPVDDEEPPLEFGRDGLVAFCRERLDLSAVALAEELEKVVREFGGDAPLGDDMSLLIVKRLPAAEYAPHEPLALVGRRDSAPA